ncbi:hypothetical protein HYC85_031350 [Camellia sinensis]|uniref:Uncharacterized protein n=1 Tax=Camellia sinensis TaxID=4442 RepID=A0A7J7FR21_CAMSI|nr:hypothetical protein HYC85_031350 [Camellia sinensis]
MEYLFWKAFLTIVQLMVLVMFFISIATQTVEATRPFDAPPRKEPKAPPSPSGCTFTPGGNGHC